MDIKAKIDEVTAKLKGDKDLMESFKKEPVKTVEKLTGIDLPDDVMSKVVDGVKAKVSLDKLGDAAGDLKDKLKKIF